MKKRTVNPVGFTLIELLVVITIIAILAALVLSVAGIVQQKSARARASSEIAAISTGLESYKVDNGDYPTGTNTSKSGPNNFLYAALTGTATGQKVYVEFNKGQLQTNGGVINIIDPFGNNYAYQYAGSATRSGTNFFDLWSYANDSSTTNTNVWIVNW